MAKYVVPKSAKEIRSDVELSLFTVVVLKHCVDEFKSAARDKRFTVRAADLIALPRPATASWDVHRYETSLSRRANQRRNSNKERKKRPNATGSRDC